ncbi:MAG: fructosamine kinase family protein [Actinomycetota bacterium]
MREWLEERVAEALGAVVVGSARLGGGDVAESFAVDLGGGRRVFAKTHRNPPPDFFQTEAAGLDWMRAAMALPVPEVLASGAGYLVLEWIDEGVGRGSGDGEAALGVGLAALHRAGAPSFGRADRRTTGSRRLPNEPCDTWVEFYAHNRLLPLARLAHDERALSESTCAGLVDLTTRLDDVGGPPEPPSRLHGDLWAGNRLVDRGGQSWLIDPAAHGGHREFDLAMMRLFGGFGDEAFAAYDEAFPLADGWADRIPLHQLAPLTVHAIKFGGGYVAATERALAAVH